MSFESLGRFAAVTQASLWSIVTAVTGVELCRTSLADYPVDARFVQTRMIWGFGGLLAVSLAAAVLSAWAAREIWTRRAGPGALRLQLVTTSVALVPLLVVLVAAAVVAAPWSCGPAALAFAALPVASGLAARRGRPVAAWALALLGLVAGALGFAVLWVCTAAGFMA
jgi:hypothetical protein